MAFLTLYERWCRRFRAVTATHLYASNSSQVYRWSYDPVNMDVLGGAPELLISNINADGMGGAPQGHKTRTLVIEEATSTLYVSVGSNANIDPDSYRSRIRRFSVANASTFPLNFEEGEVFADGIRNEVALEWARDGILWGAMNAADRLYHPDLGGEIYNDNPAEELHRFAPAGHNYGYPFCWRESRYTDRLQGGLCSHQWHGGSRWYCRQSR
jgi:glucose/arabinose dehydrogenase